MGTNLKKIKELILKCINFRNYFGEHLQGLKFLSNHDQTLSTCLFHGDTTGSLSVNLANGLWNCKGCYAKGDVFTFHQKIYHLAGFQETVVHLANQLGIDTSSEKVCGRPRKQTGEGKHMETHQPASPSPSAPFSVPPVEPLNDGIAQAYHQALITSPESLAWLLEHRGITIETVKRFDLGLSKDEHRITIPVYDHDGRLINIRKYSPRVAKNKMLGMPGRNQAMLYGYPTAAGGQNIICEGEFDRLLLCQAGFHAITHTNGANSFHPAWAPLFAGLDVVLIYDADAAGRESYRITDHQPLGAGRTAAIFKSVAKSIRIVDLTTHGLVEGTKDSKDISDLARARPADWAPTLQAAIDATPTWDGDPWPAAAGGEGKNNADPSAPSSEAAADTEKPTQVDAARRVIQTIGLGNLVSHKLTVWRWNGKGIWEMTDDRMLKVEVHHQIPARFLSKSYTEGVLDSIKTETAIKKIPFDQNQQAINCQNGELLWTGTTWDFQPHCREHYRLSQIPVAYDPDARAPRFEKFLEQIFAPDVDIKEKVIAVCEALGYSLLPSTKYEKFWIFVGQGSNGKSVLMAILKALVGPEHVAAVQPDQLSNKFQRSYLHGKLINLVTEISEGHVFDDAALKAIVSGEPTTAEFKHQAPFTFSPYATCFFATNHMPRTRDFSNALFRRAIIINFNQRFVEQNSPDAINNPGLIVQNPDLAEELIEELPGILNLALDAIGAVFLRGSFTTIPSSEADKADWKISSDQVAQFVEEECLVGEGYRISSPQLYRAYKDWAEENGIKHALAQNTLSSRLKKWGVSAIKSAHGSRFLVGIGLISGNE